MSRVVAPKAPKFSNEPGLHYRDMFIHVSKQLNLPWISLWVSGQMKKKDEFTKIDYLNRGSNKMSTTQDQDQERNM